MVFYFTATGNSLYAAMQLDEERISIPQVKDAHPVFKAERIGIVCPVYCGELPSIVTDFIRRTTFDTPYLYLVLTYGSEMADCPEFTNAQLESMGVRAAYIGAVLTVDNYLPAFDMDRQKAMEKDEDGQIARIKADVAAKRVFIPKATAKSRKMHRTVAAMNRIMPSLNNGSMLQVTDDCYGCGVCAKVCPVGNLRMENGRSVRVQKTCLFCLACAHACPAGAVKLKKEKNPNARYRNENITLTQIVKSNQQTKECI